MAYGAGFDRDAVLLIEPADPQPSGSRQRDRRTIGGDRDVSLAERKRGAMFEERDHYMNRCRWRPVPRSSAGEPQRGDGEDASGGGGDPRDAAAPCWPCGGGVLVATGERILEENADVAHVLHPSREILLEAALDDSPRQRRRTWGQRRVIGLRFEHTRKRFCRRVAP